MSFVPNLEACQCLLLIFDASFDILFTFLPDMSRKTSSSKCQLRGWCWQDVMFALFFTFNQSVCVCVWVRMFVLADAGPAYPK